MLNFSKIKAESFYSLGEVELNLNAGLYIVKGYNQDIKTVDNTSNGAGKTSLFNAIYQGLYNKNLKDTNGSVQSVNNKYLDKPYKIEISLIKAGIPYTIINDRNTMEIQILKEGKNIAPKGIQNALKVVKEKIIGFPFEIFTSLTYLNSAVLDNIIELTNKNNLLYQFFEIDKLLAYQKQLSELIKVKNNDLKIIQTKIDNTLDILSLIDDTLEQDKNDLLREKQELQERLVAIENSKEWLLVDNLTKEVETLSKKVSELNNKMIEKKQVTNTLYKNFKTLESGICPICKQDVTLDTYLAAKKEFEKAKDEYYKIEKEFKSLQTKLTGLKTKRDNLKNKLLDQKRSILSAINNLDRQLDKDNSKAHLINKKDDILKEKEKLQTKYLNLSQEITYLKDVLKALKSGVVLNKYLEKYINLLKININHYSKFTDFNFNIRVTVGKNGLIYKFIESGVVKEFSQLSSGEKTRVSFLILVSTIKALEQLVGVNINFLVLDELLGVLDEEGLEFIKSLLRELKSEKAIFIITHHNEIDESDVDYVLNVTKSNNISSVNLKGVEYV